MLVCKRKTLEQQSWNYCNWLRRWVVAVKQVSSKDLPICKFCYRALVCVIVCVCDLLLSAISYYSLNLYIRLTKLPKVEILNKGKSGEIELQSIYYDPLLSELIADQDKTLRYGGEISLSMTRIG
ncbi:hypothetical protein BDA99DRAFT_527025 [Phascolomyces articulosus]|uniref:Uncharacterized protein n=1 Tax=Phascolomyces articulosus TaxID=60185 RepID=A0AAD5JZ87_9FUNG|nr:hypothetical protein BDA99DRAFT_527025 [Phascolomyces articulosus]